MRTIEATATFTEDGKMIMQSPSDVMPGEYQVVVVVGEKPQVKSALISTYPDLNTNLDTGIDLEDLYNDEEVEGEDIRAFPDSPTHKKVGLADQVITIPQKKGGLDLKDFPSVSVGAWPTAASIFDLQDLYDDEEQMEGDDDRLFPDWPHHNIVLANPNSTFRREEMYNDDGR